MVGHFLDAIGITLVAFGAIIGIAVVGAAVVGLPVKWMMNYLFTPALLRSTFGVSQMTFWKAFWLFVLIAFCFGPIAFRFAR